MTLKEIQGIIRDFEASSLTTLELETGDVKLKLSKLHQPAGPNAPTAVQPAQSSAEAPAIATENPTCVAVKSPLVGTFYASATPGGEAFARVGQPIRKGQAVCIIEAMKIMNEIVAPVDGVVERIDVKNGQVVGFDQVLLTIHTGVADAQ